MTATYITTTIPYVNARPHIGHALELVQADVLARYRRGRGDAVRFQSGTDDNSLKNVLAAEAAGVEVRQFVDRNAEAFLALGEALSLTVDDFIRIAAWRPRPSGRGGNAASPPQECRRHSLVCSHVPVPAAPHPRPAGGAAGPLRARPVRMEPGRRAARALGPRPGGGDRPGGGGLRSVVHGRVAALPGPDRAGAGQAAAAAAHAGPRCAGLEPPRPGEVRDRPAAGPGDGPA